MRLPAMTPRTLLLETTAAEFFLANHAQLARMANEARFSRRNDNARTYGKAARGMLAAYGRIKAKESQS